MVAIVDYGAGNIFSIQNMLKQIGIHAVMGSDESTIAKADKLILPGVGAFDSCVHKLHESGLQLALKKKIIENKTPVLGICVGMQLMMDESEEGMLPGLGWIKGKTLKFDKDKIGTDLKIPNMGWANVEINKPSKLFENMYEDPRFYFVHSYYVQPENESDVLLYASHGYRFTAALERDNIVAVQFHPEKSHKYGMKLLENFVKNIEKDTRIPLLLIQKGGLVKSVKFKNHKYIGDPINAVKIFNDKEVDEIVIVDISATADKKQPNWQQIRDLASEAFMPLAYGGGITTLDEVKCLINMGVEKIILNNSAISNPILIEQCASWAGSQSVVVSMDIRKNFWGKYNLYNDNGSRKTSVDPILFATQMENAGAGEILLQSIDNDGTFDGFALDIISQMSKRVNIPVVAAGGAGSMDDFRKAVTAGASAVAAGSMFLLQRPYNAVLISYPSQGRLKGTIVFTG